MEGGGDFLSKTPGLGGPCTAFGECTGVVDDCDRFLLCLYGITGGGTLLFVLNHQYVVIIQCTLGIGLPISFSSISILNYIKSNKIHQQYHVNYKLVCVYIHAKFDLKFTTKPIVVLEAVFP